MSEPTHSHSVVDGQLVRTSVSQMQTAYSCLRKWYFDKVLHRPRKPPGKGAERGKLGHERIEHYLLTGEDVLTPLERKGMSYYPPRGADLGASLGVEQEFDGTLTALDVPLLGYIDLVNPRELPLLQLTDWKFKKSIDQWGCAAEDLINPQHEAGIQMLGYAQWGVNTFKAAEAIRLAHVTFQTQGAPDVVETSVTISVDEVGPLWDTVSRSVIPGMKEAAQAVSAHDVPCNLKACDKYGGCDFKEECLSKGARILRGLKGAKMGIGYRPSGSVSKPITDSATAQKVSVEAVQPQPAVPTIQPPPPPGPPPPKPAPPPAQASAAPATSPATYGFCKSCGMKLSAENASKNASGAVHIGCAKQKRVTIEDVVVEAAPPVQAPPIEAAPPVQAPPIEAPVQAPPIEAPVQALPVILPPDAPVSRGVEAQAQPPTPKPAPPAPKQKAPKAKAQPAHEAPVLSDAPKSSDTPPEPAVNTGVFLYFRCAPQGVATQTLHTYVRGLERIIANLAQRVIDDLRGESSTEFGFGKWKAYLSDAARENPPPAGHYIVDTDERNEVVATALSALLPPGHVVRG